MRVRTHHHPSRGEGDPHSSTEIEETESFPRREHRMPPRRMRLLVTIALAAVCFMFLIMSMVKGNNNDDGDYHSTEHQQHHGLHHPRVFETGMDVSEALSVLRGGGRLYYPNGTTEADPVAIVSQAGHEWIRVRIMVDPDGYYGLDQDLEYVQDLIYHARRVHPQLKILLDFHYSHWWCDGTNQWSPDRWRVPRHSDTIPIKELRKAVYQYTYETMEALVGLDGRFYPTKMWPDAVQVGNEISQGMLWEDARIPLAGEWDPDNPPREWRNLQSLLQSATNAIRDVSKAYSDVALQEPQTPPKIMIHLDTGGDTRLTEKWIRTFFHLGGNCDIIGLSYYPQWHGSVTALTDNIRNLARRFPRQQVWVVETAYYYEGTCDGLDYLECRQQLPFEMTKRGQARYLSNLRSALLESTHCSALFYWGSHWTQPHKWFKTRTETEEPWDDARRRALFDPQGVVNPGICTLSNSTSDFCRFAEQIDESEIA